MYEAIPRRTPSSNLSKKSRLNPSPIRWLRPNTNVLLVVLTCSVPSNENYSLLKTKTNELGMVFIPTKVLLSKFQASQCYRAALQGLAP